MKKPTMQDIANALEISRITVWKVLNNQPGVSDVTMERILQMAGQLGYPLPEQLLHNNTQAPEQLSNDIPLFAEGSGAVISIVVSRPDSSVFWINIIHQIAKEISKTGCSLLYTYIPDTPPPGYTLPPQLTGNMVQGIIVLNVYDCALLGMLNQLDVPKVFLDTVSSFDVSSLTGDLLLLEGRSTVQQITSSLIDKGHHKIGFIGDIHYALTNRFRYDGFKDALENHGLDLIPVFCRTGSIGISTYQDEISDFLRNLPELPDAFVCVSDFIAHTVYQTLKLGGIRVPQDIVLTGFDNVPDYQEMIDFLTTVNVNTPLLGKRLCTQLLYRILNPEAPYETIFLRSEIIFR